MRKPKLAHNWRAVLRHSWSVRLIALAAVLSGLEVALPFVGYKLPVSDMARAGIYFAVVSGAFVARLLAQKKVSGR